MRPLATRLRLALLLPGLLAVGCARERAPDILLVTVDTLRADHVGAYGHAEARTPNVDALAKSGTLFREATTPFPRTTPALASLLTGLWAHHHGSREVGRSMKAVPTLAAVLQASGYETRGVTANGSAGRSQGLDAGFASFISTEEFTGWRAENTTKRALGLLASAPKEKPLLFWVHYVDPHFPYEPPRGFPDQPPGRLCHRLLGRNLHGEITAGQLHADWNGEASRALGDCLGLYDAEIAYVDVELGKLLAAWREARGTRTVIVFTADHGENMGEDGLYYEHGPSVHDASLRVPLIVAGAGRAGQVDKGVARLEDVMPTLLGLARVPKERWPKMDGADLGARLAGKPAASEGADDAAYAESGNDLLVESYASLRSGPRFSEHCVNGPRFSRCDGGPLRLVLYDHVADPERRRDVSRQHPDEMARLAAVDQRWPLEEARQRTIRTPRYKLVARPGPDGYETRLFDLTADPGETRDVAAQNPALAERMRSALDRWARDIPGSGGAEHTPEQIEALRALGYVE